MPDAINLENQGQSDQNQQQQFYHDNQVVYGQMIPEAVENDEEEH